MSAVTASPRRARRRRDAEPVADSLFDALGSENQCLRTPDAAPSEPTLDDLLSGVWTGLAQQQIVECPVCGEAMAPDLTSDGEPVGGRCQSCQTLVR